MKKYLTNFIIQKKKNNLNILMFKYKTEGRCKVKTEAKYKVKHGKWSQNVNL